MQRSTDVTRTPVTSPFIPTKWCITLAGDSGEMSVDWRLLTLSPARSPAAHCACGNNSNHLRTGCVGTAMTLLNSACGRLLELPYAAPPFMAAGERRWGADCAGPARTMADD